MKNFKLFKFNILAPIIIFFSILLFGCKKENNTNEVISESKAILAVKNIVGEKGTLTVLSNHSNSVNQSMQINEETIKPLSLKDFQSAFNSLSIDSSGKIVVTGSTFDNSDVSRLLVLNIVRFNLFQVVYFLKHTLILFFQFE